MKQNDTPEILAKEIALEKAIEAETEAVQVAFRQAKIKQNAIIDKIGPLLDKRKECQDRLFQHQNPHWWEHPFTYLITGCVLLSIPLSLINYLGLVFLTYSVIIYITRLIELERYRRERDNAESAYDALEFRWKSLGENFLIYFEILHNEGKRLLALEFFEQSRLNDIYWENLRLNSEREIFYRLAGRLSPHIYNSNWDNPLDASERDYIENIPKKIANSNFIDFD